jgi:hypothetical protein
MDIIRLALVNFEPELRRDELGPTLEINDVIVEVDTVWADGSNVVHQILLTGRKALAVLPECDDNNYIIVPRDQLRDIERAIETYTDFVAVARGCRRTIGSPQQRYISFIPRSEDEQNWLSKMAGVRHGSGAAIAVTRHYEFPLSQEIVEALVDRVDGVQLLAEAFSQTHATGRFHELIRFFERAFALRSGALTNPLARFLSGAVHPFTAREVQRWCETRGPATHADRRPVFLTEGDVRPLIDRMEFAAYDTLLHKEKWRDASHARRVLSKENPLRDLRRGFTPIDPFGCWPISLTGPQIEMRPEWWFKPSPEPPEVRVMDAFEDPLADLR